MKFILTAGWDDGIASLAERLIKELSHTDAHPEGRKVLWLVSGGSNTWPAVQIMSMIEDSLTTNLTVGLADERHGPEGHVHSNWTGLVQAGFDPKQAKVLTVLHEQESIGETARRYQQTIAQAFEQAELIIAQLGIGADGHTAGILPGSPAVQDTNELVVGFPGEPWARITLTFAALRRVNAAYAFSFGEAKARALQLLQENLTPHDQPAQILKELPEAYLYNDQIGDRV